MTDTQRLDLLIGALFAAGFILPPELIPPGFVLVDGQLVRETAIAVATDTAPAGADTTGEVAQ